MRNLLIPVCLLFSYNLSWAQEDGTVMELGVREAIHFAQQNSQKAKTAEIDISQADKDVWIQASKGLPIVNGTANFTNFIDLPTSIIPAEAFGAPAGTPPIAAQFGQKYTMDAGLTVGLQLFDGYYIIGVKGAKGYQKMSRDMAKMTQNEIETIIAESYYTSQIAKENVRLLGVNIANTEKTVAETKELYKAGFAEEMDVEQLDLLMNTLKNREQMAKRQHEATLNLLKYQMGMPVKTPIILKDDLETLWTLQSSESLLSQELKLDENLAYNLIKQDVVMHGYLVKLEEAKYYPKLNAFFDYKYQAFRNQFDFFDGSKSWYPQTLWGVKLSVPIWDNLGGLSSINKAKLEQQKIKNKLADMEQALTLQAITARDGFVSALEQLETSEKNIDLATRIKEKTLFRYKEGMATSMELTTVENQLVQAQADYINTLFSAMDAKLELYKALENN
ncbi:MAG: TolC family protein [Flavobacteriales bacterium]|nr:TolC family protein [Flavobacteriales bacterium]